MKFQFEKFGFNKIVYILSFALILFTFGCEAPTTTITTTNTTAANTAAATPSASPAENKAAVLPVTLPVLDAMFADDGFGDELKSKLQLTDEQIDKLKAAAHDAVSNLNEDGENTGSTRAAREKSEKQIREIIGGEKTASLFEMVSRRWNGGDKPDDAANAKPGALPTDTRVVVNAPAYRMDLFDNGKLVKTYKIGIGYPEFPLPVGMRKADTIIFNPTWTPPDEPWVKGKFAPGKKVEAGSKDNPLGPIKIPIGLPSLVHGGKQASRLGGFASHGCVGLTNNQIQDFALNIARLSGSELMPEDVKNYEKQKEETKNFKLEKTVPVELRYETIVVEAGKLKIFRDVYERGTNTEENLRAVLDGYGVSLDSLKAPERQKILDGLKQMAIDATGQPVDSNAANANSNVNQNANSKTGDNSKANANSDGGSVTRTIKGKKEVVFELAELKGKGYPAPVNLSQQ